MLLPQKRWFRIAEVAKRWTIPLTDIEDYALDEMLQLAVFVVDMPAEAGTWENGGQGDFPLLQSLSILNVRNRFCVAACSRSSAMAKQKSAAFDHNCRTPICISASMHQP